jgi:GNAT superfamily N-acetyltransferase
MRTFTDDLLRQAGDVLAGSFFDDPLNQLTLAGVKRARELAAVHARMHVRHAARHGYLFLLDDDPKAIFIGVDSLAEAKFAETLLQMRIGVRTLFMVDGADRRILLDNYKRMKKVLSFDWHNEFVEGRYYRFKIIAVDPALRGKGAFRRLVKPQIAFCDGEGIPIILETHNPVNVPLYEHFGFKLVRTIEPEDMEIRQYCMIRPAEGRVKTGRSDVRTEVSAA